MADTASQIGKNLREARRRSGLTQEEVATYLRVDKMSVSRWERGERAIKAEDYQKAMELFAQTSWNPIAVGAIGAERAAELDQNVSRGTSGLVGEQRKPYGNARNRLTHSAAVAGFAYQLAGSIVQKLELFKREMIRAGADDAEIDYIEETFRRPETARLAHHDSDGKDLSPKQVEDQYDALIDGVRHIITRRIERRRKVVKAK